MNLKGGNTKGLLFLGGMALMLSCILNSPLSVGAHPVPAEQKSSSDDTSAQVSDAAAPKQDSKVYSDMLQILEDVEQSQVALQEALKAPQRREDAASSASASGGGGGTEQTAAASSPIAKLLDMEHIVKALENVAATLSKGSKGLTADASNTEEAVLRNERDSGYGVPSQSYGPNTVAETPNNFINVFSQAAANTVNFATQLLNSLVGVAANILQGTVSTLLSLLNAKGQIVGAVVQSAPPVLASVTRTAGDVLAAKARIFGAVTQSAVNFGSQLASTLTNTFSALFNGPNAINWNALSRRDTGGGGGGGGALAGFGNLGQTIVNSQLNLLNGILAPFVNGGRASTSSSASTNPLSALFSSLTSGNNPLAALFRGRSGSNDDSSSSSSGDSSSSGEPNFRITIGRGRKEDSSPSSSDSEDSVDVPEGDSASSGDTDPPATPTEPGDEEKLKKK